MINEEKTKELFEKAVEKAKSLLGDTEQIGILIEDIEARIKSASLKDALAYIPLFLELLKSWFKGEYKAVPAGTIAAIVGTLLYWVSPIDCIPDFIPVAGQLDDAAVAAFCFKCIKGDLDRYKAWKETK